MATVLRTALCGCRGRKARDRGPAARARQKLFRRLAVPRGHAWVWRAAQTADVIMEKRTVVQPVLHLAQRTHAGVQQNGRPAFCIYAQWRQRFAPKVAPRRPAALCCSPFAPCTSGPSPSPGSSPTRTPRPSSRSAPGTTSSVRRGAPPPAGPLATGAAGLCAVALLVPRVLTCALAHHRLRNTRLSLCSRSQRLGKVKLLPGHPLCPQRHVHQHAPGGGTSPCRAAAAPRECGFRMDTRRVARRLCPVLPSASPCALARPSRWPR